MTTNPDLRTVRKDDRLLDRLGRGEPVRGDDVEAMLSAWRRTLPVADPPEPRLVAAVTRKPVPKRRRARTSVGIAASFVLLGGGVTTAAAFAQPDSPLWPVTRFVYSDLADSRQALDNASHAVSDARIAIQQGRFDDAAQLLADADALAAKVDPAAADRLRKEIAGMRDQLPAGTNIPEPASDPSKRDKGAGAETSSLAPQEEPENEPNAEQESGEGRSQDGPGEPNEDPPGGSQPDDPEDDDGDGEHGKPPNDKPKPTTGKPEKPTP